MLVPPRRWLQFSLRGMIILTLCAACYLAGQVHTQWRMQRQLEQAVAEAKAEAKQPNWTVVTYDPLVVTKQVANVEPVVRGVVQPMLIEIESFQLNGIQPWPESSP